MTLIKFVCAQYKCLDVFYKYIICGIIDIINVRSMYLKSVPISDIPILVLCRP